MKYLVLFLYATSVAALAQKFPAPDETFRADCPKGWHSLGQTILVIGSIYDGPNYRMYEGCIPENRLSGRGDYYDYTEQEVKDRNGNPGRETSFRQFGGTWSHQINGFSLQGGRQMKVDEVFENRSKVLQEEFKDRGARLLASKESQDQWLRQESFTYRDGSAKVFVKLIVGCNVIVEQRVRVKCEKCDEDATGSRELYKLQEGVFVDTVAPCR